MEQLLIGVVIGIITGVFLGDLVGGDNITNKIGKIKKNNAPVDVTQLHAKKNRGILKRIFKRKNREHGNSN